MNLRCCYSGTNLHISFRPNFYQFHSNLNDVNNTQHSCTSKSSLQATNQYNQWTFRSGIIIYRHCGMEWLACEPVCTPCHLNEGHFVHWTLRIVWLGSLAKLIFMAIEHHGIKEEARQTLSMVVCETVHLNSMLRNHRTQYTKFKHKCNWLYEPGTHLIVLVIPYPTARTSYSIYHFESIHEVWVWGCIWDSKSMSCKSSIRAFI